MLEILVELQAHTGNHGAAATWRDELEAATPELDRIPAGGSR